jgi:mRNA interferase RelE/StbE
MAWKIELTESARKQFGKLDRPIAKRILSFLHERVEQLDDPRSIGEALRGTKLAPSRSALGDKRLYATLRLLQSLSNFWKYRLGDYRIIVSIEDDRLLILIVRIGHRREVYR